MDPPKTPAPGSLKRYLFGETTSLQTPRAQAASAAPTGDSPASSTETSSSSPGHLSLSGDGDLPHAQMDALVRSLPTKSELSTMPTLAYNLEENRGRCNNLRIRGLLEATMDPDLADMVRGIFNTILAKPQTSPLLFDSIHHALKPRGLPPEEPTPREM